MINSLPKFDEEPLKNYGDLQHEPKAGDMGGFSPPPMETDSRTNIDNHFQAQQPKELTENANPYMAGEEQNGQLFTSEPKQKRFVLPSVAMTTLTKRTVEESQALYEDVADERIQKGEISTELFSGINKNSSPTVKKLFTEQMKGNEVDWTNLLDTVSDNDIGEVLGENLSETDTYDKLFSLLRDKGSNTPVAQVIYDYNKLIRLKALGELAKVESVDSTNTREENIDLAISNIREEAKGSLNNGFLERALVQFKDNVSDLDTGDDDWEQKVTDYEQRREELSNTDFHDKANDIVAQVSRSFNSGLSDLLAMEDIKKTAYALMVEKGLEAQITESGDLIVKDNDGKWQTAEETFMDSIYYSAGEIGGSVVGALAGTGAGMVATASTAGAGAVTIPALTVIGAGTGAGIGRDIDLSNLSDINKKVRQQLEVNKNLLVNYKKESEMRELTDYEKEEYNNSLMVLVGEQYIRNENLSVSSRLGNMANSFVEDVVLGAAVGKVAKLLDSSGVLSTAGNTVKKVVEKTKADGVVKAGVSAVKSAGKSIKSIHRAPDFVVSSVLGDSLSNNLARIYKENSGSTKSFVDELFNAYKKVNDGDLGSPNFNIFKEVVGEDGTKKTKLKKYLGTEGRASLAYLASMSDNIQLVKTIGQAGDYASRQSERAAKILTKKYLPEIIENLFVLKKEADRLLNAGETSASKELFLGSQKAVQLINLIKNKTAGGISVAKEAVDNTFKKVPPREVELRAGRKINLPFSYSSVPVSKLSEVFYDGAKGGGSLEGLQNFISGINRDVSSIYKPLRGDYPNSYKEIKRNIGGIIKDGRIPEKGNIILPTSFLQDLGEVIRDRGGLDSLKLKKALNELGNQILDTKVYPEVAKVTKKIKDKTITKEIDKAKKDLSLAKAHSADTFTGFESIGLKLRGISSDLGKENKDKVQEYLKNLSGVVVNDTTEKVDQYGYESVVAALKDDKLVSQFDGIILSERISRTFKGLLENMGAELVTSNNKKKTLEGIAEKIAAKLTENGDSRSLKDFIKNVDKLKSLDSQITLKSKLGRDTSRVMANYYDTNAPLTSLLEHIIKGVESSEGAYKASSSSRLDNSILAPISQAIITTAMKPFLFAGHSLTSRIPFIRKTWISEPITKLKLLRSLNTALDSSKTLDGEPLPKAVIENIRRKTVGRVQKGLDSSKTAYKAYGEVVIPLTKSKEPSYLVDKRGGSLRVVPTDTVPTGGNYGTKENYKVIPNLEVTDKIFILDKINKNNGLNRHLSDNLSEKIDTEELTKQLLESGGKTKGKSEVETEAKKRIKSIIANFENDTERYILWEGVMHETKPLLK